MRVYLDNCCLNRPFDDQRQTRVRLEAEATLCIQDHIRRGTLELAWSYLLDFENAANPFAERRMAVEKWRGVAVLDVEAGEIVLQQARSLVAVGLRPKDALHVACAIASQSAYFVTTDDNVLKRAGEINNVRVIDPVALVREARL